MTLIRRLRTRRAVRVLVLAALPVGLVLIVSAWRDLTLAQRDLGSARKRIQQVSADAASLQTPDGRRAAYVEIDLALGAITDARGRLAGSITLDLARLVPGLRTQRSGLFDVIDDASAGARTGRELLAHADGLASRLTVAEGRLPIEALVDLEVGVRTAAEEIAVLQSPADGLWWPVRGARQGLNRAVADGSVRLSAAADSLDATRGFLGGDGPRRHLVALQNNAEMRAQGMVLSYAVLTVDAGSVSLDQGGSVQDLALDQPVDAVLPAGTAEVFGPLKPLQLWQSVNATPDFSVSGRVMADMYRQATSESVSGVIGIDVPGLSAILKVIGPVNLDGVEEPISSDSAARVLLNDLYREHDESGNQEQRRERLHELTATVFLRLMSSGVDVVALGQELGTASGGGHLRLWSGDTSEQEVFRRQGLSGGPAEVFADRTFHVAVENRTANKVDYFVRPSIHQRVTIGAAGDAVIRTIVTVENQAPAGAAPSYQLSSTLPDFAPGEYMAWVLMWAPTGSTDRDGGVPESGLVVSHRVVVVAPGESRQVVFETTLPGAVRNGRLDLRYFPQPRLIPTSLTVEILAPGWRLEENPDWTGVVDTTRTLTWQMERR